MTEPCRPDESGSSPLSRGIRRRDQETRHRVGIIPALAGNTAAPHWRSFRRPDHPRSRGEYSVMVSFLPQRGGSSPLSRGIRRSRGGRADVVRIIPALAGNTWTAWSTPIRPRDHPRSRGEYDSVPAMLSRREGSSPLSRGIRAVLAVCFEVAGIIPALAGNTCWS